MKPVPIGWVAFGLLSMAVAWAIFKNPPTNPDTGSFWAVVLLFAIPMLGFGIGAVVWGSRLDRQGRGGTGALLSTGLGVVLIAAFALVILWAALLTVSDH